MTKKTPWTYRNGSRIYLDGSEVAQISFATDAHEIGFGISEAEHSANARLIAAAAELLDALEWLNAEFECRDDEFGGALFTRNDFERVRKAIAKAEGIQEADHK